MWYDIRRTAIVKACAALEAAFHATLSAKFPATFERCRMRRALDASLAAEAPTLRMLTSAANLLLILFVRSIT